jgi:SAM-dependent methyltransferase
MRKEPSATSWNPEFDNQPTSDVPRIKFSRMFSDKYLEKKNLILEIGCGTGSYTRLIDRTSCIGLDISLDAVKVAKNYCTRSEFVVASAMDLPFKNETFDLVCTWGVFEEIPAGAEKQIMIEVKRTLISEGIFVLSAYGDHIIAKILDPAFIIRGVRHYNPEQFINLISEYGFEINEYTIRGGLNTLVSNFLFYFSKHVLQKKDAPFKKFFDKKSANEIYDGKSGIVYMYIAGHKKKQS